MIIFFIIKNINFRIFNHFIIYRNTSCCPLLIFFSSIPLYLFPHQNELKMKIMVIKYSGKQSINFFFTSQLYYPQIKKSEKLKKLGG